MGSGEGCSGACARIILFVVNFIVFLCGAALLGIGLALLLSTDAWDWFDDLGLEDGLDDPLIAAAVYSMIAVGGLLFVVGFFGCCGACKESKCMLMTYAIFVILLLLVQITVIVLAIVFRNEIGSEIEESMTKAVKESYGVTDTVTTAWDEMQHDWQCCGGSDYNDYMNSTWYLNQNDTAHIIPASCCTAADVSNGGEVDIEEMEYDACVASAAAGDEDLYFTRGCYDELHDWVDENTLIIIAVVASLAVIQIFAVLIACGLSSSDNGYEL